MSLCGTTEVLSTAEVPSKEVAEIGTVVLPDFDVYWDGDDDPANPMNWSSKLKWTQIIIVSLLTFISSLGSSMLAPAVPDVMASLQTDDGALDSFVVSVYVIGYAIGPLFMAPLSELFGRNIVYHFSNVLFFGCTIGCALSVNVGMFIAFRFLSGLAGVAPLALGGGTIGDVMPHESLGMPMAIWGLGSLVPPVIAPVLGGYLDEYVGWRWIFWVLAIPMGLVTLVSLFLLRETYAPVLLERKAKRCRKETANSSYRSRLAGSEMSANKIIAIALIRPLKLLVTSPIVALLSLDTAVVYGYEYLVFTTLSYVFEEHYNFSAGMTGLTYLGTGIGTVLGVLVVGAASDKVAKRQKAPNGQPKPEPGLWPLVPASFIIPCSLFWYGWSLESHSNPVVPLVGLGFFGFAMMATFMPVSMYLIKTFTVHSASAIAASNVLRSLLGALLPLGGQGLYDALGYGWGNSLLAFISIALIPIPFLLIRYGSKLRARDRNLKDT